MRGEKKGHSKSVSKKKFRPLVLEKKRRKSKKDSKDELFFFFFDSSAALSSSCAFRMIDRAPLPPSVWVRSSASAQRTSARCFAFSFFASSIDGRWIRQRHAIRARDDDLFRILPNDTHPKSKRCRAVFRRGQRRERERERPQPHFQTPKRLAPLPAKKRTTTKARTWTLVALRPATDAIC